MPEKVWRAGYGLLKKENLPLSGQWIFTPIEDAIHFILSSSMRIMTQNLELSLLPLQKRHKSLFIFRTAVGKC